MAAASGSTAIARKPCLRWRWALVWATQLLFYGLPWLEWGSRPAVLFECVGVPGVIEQVMVNAPRDARIVVSFRPAYVATIACVAASGMAGAAAATSSRRWRRRLRGSASSRRPAAAWARAGTAVFSAS